MNQGPTDLETMIAALNLLDHHGVDWQRVQRTAYLIHQHLRYEYPGPIYDLQQRLMIVPPEYYNDQRRIIYRLDVSVPDYEITSQDDDYGNAVLTVHVPQVAQSITFEVWIVIERHAGGPHYVPITLLTAAPFLQASALTQPNEALRAVAQELASDGATGLVLAKRINDWTHEALVYTHDVTTIRTTAAEALALGQGVCQDYSHIMLTLCRLCGLPARYVSGHLLGEGGTHAWVEVFLPSDERPEEAVAVPFDPTNGNLAGLSYLTIAVGRDYYDVAPTSGTFRASYRGQLSASKRVGLTVLEYANTPEEL